MVLKSFIKMHLLSFIFSLFWLNSAQAEFLSGADASLLNTNDVVSHVQPGDIFVIGELHGQAGSQQGQLEVLRALRARGLRVSVGFEFLEYPYQSTVDDFRFGKISEADFLKTVRWGQGFSFDFYRDQLLFPNILNQEQSRALNCPRELTGQIAKQGIDSLTSAQRAQLPSTIEKGNDHYFERFKASMGAHVPSPEALERYFWAQSTWDESMAWQALSFLKQNPDQVLVIIVGEFHVQYGGGLPDRLRSRGAQKVWTMSEISRDGLNEQELKSELEPSTQDGQRADYFWIFD